MKYENVKPTKFDDLYTQQEELYKHDGHYVCRCCHVFMEAI